MRISKNVLFPISKAWDGMNYKIVREAKIRLTPVPTVLHSATHHRPQSDFGYRKTTLEPLPTKHTHYTFKSSFLYIPEIVRAASEFLAHYKLQAPTSLKYLV